MISTCVKCGHHLFELMKLDVKTASGYAIQCANCGVIVGTALYDDTNSLLREQNKALKLIADEEEACQFYALVARQFRQDLETAGGPDSFLQLRPTRVAIGRPAASRRDIRDMIEAYATTLRDLQELATRRDTSVTPPTRPPPSA